MRYALYLTPPSSHRLTQVASRWLGRDAFSGRTFEPACAGAFSAAEIARHTESPRRYGFHGTLKAPFALADPEDHPDFLAALMNFCSARERFAMPRLAVTQLGPFFALTPAEPSDDLQSIADDVVRDFDHFRAPLTDADIARRAPERLTETERAYLKRWGYPYVFEAFRFHMTLTGPVPEDEAPRMRAHLEALFEPVLAEPLDFDSLALFIEPKRGEPFVVDSLHPLGKIEHRRERSAEKTAAGTQ
jgi:putative phosphonate metabolism protein